MFVKFRTNVLKYCSCNRVKHFHLNQMFTTNSAISPYNVMYVCLLCRCSCHTNSFQSLLTNANVSYVSANHHTLSNTIVTTYMLASWDNLTSIIRISHYCGHLISLTLNKLISKLMASAPKFSTQKCGSLSSQLRSAHQIFGQKFIYLFILIKLNIYR